MNVAIGNIIKGLLDPFQVGGIGSNQFIDKLAGVVKVISVSERNESEGQITKTFPISCNLTYAECNRSWGYKDLIPNSNYGCMVYLEEEGGVDKIETLRTSTKYKTSLLLVGWINQKKLGSNECSVTGLIVNTIIAALSAKPFNSDIYQTIQIEVVGQNPKSVNPFSKYTYDEDNTKYLMAPFDYFSLKIDVTFSVNSLCLTPFEKTNEIICNS